MKGLTLGPPVMTEVYRATNYVVYDMQCLTQLLSMEGLEDDTKASINATIRYLAEELQQEKRHGCQDSEVVVCDTGEVFRVSDEEVPGKKDEVQESENEKWSKWEETRE
ncbi:hypothetical protein FZC76_21690 [Sutcliffiella horikoshii]|uniref:Uncharacterized protein n=1 Tax=Sutcliffiella horikoshii TaxID=79883 RepID=A0A5D4SFB3_9BACI|nr:hypothetical protein [Sutcliffiella horikoshii]TYS60486.1 hypothetical protein FZC76_21690 [Sutcliffiella horikoshii]